MAIAQTGSVLEFAVGAGTSGTVSSTIAVPADAELVIVTVSTYHGTAGAMSTAGTVTFTKSSSDTDMLVGAAGDDDNSVFMGVLWYLVAPDTGSNKSLKFDWGSSTSNDMVWSVSFWKGINTSSPVGDSDVAHDSAIFFNGISSATLTATTGDLIFASFAAYNNGAEQTPSSYTNLTELAALTTSNSSDGALAIDSPSGNEAVGTPAASTSDWLDGTLCTIVLQPAAAAGGVSPMMGLLGVGA